MYNFDDISDRYNTYSLKWDCDKNILPMWVADMDFKVLPEIKEAIIRRSNIESYGYSITPDEYFDAYKNFFLRNHDISYDKKDMIFSLGVVPSISSMVRSLTNIGDNVVILTPVYNIFFNSIRNNHRVILECPLDYNNYEYSINFLDLEDKLKDDNTTLLIFCNPHNPIGKIWEYDDLKKVVDLCNKYNVTIISDEIHCDIAKRKYTPIYKVEGSEKNTVVCLSATKCFNMAGAQSSIVICKNRELYRKVNRGLNTDEVAEGNFFGYEMTIEALNKGDLWLKEMNQYVNNNFDYLYKFLNENFKDIVCIKREALYLAWLDVSKITKDTVKFVNFIKNKTGLWISDGDQYGKTGVGFVRINLATSFNNVKDGLNRFKNGIELFKEEA